MRLAVVLLLCMILTRMHQCRLPGAAGGTKWHASQGGACQSVPGLKTF